MSANTTPDNITYPVSTDQVAPLETVFATMAASIQAALSARFGNVAGVVPSLPVGSASARNTLFPAPVQGNRVWRTDTGTEEVYYAAYNATTNIGGITPAGWYNDTNIYQITGQLSKIGGIYQTFPASSRVIRKITYVEATTNPAGVVTVTFTTAFPNGVAHISVMTHTGTAASPVINGGSLSKTGVQLVWGAANTAISFSYEAVGW
jgi:hypothetical protein